MKKSNNLFIAICLCISALCMAACNFSVSHTKDGFRDSEKWGKVVTKTIEVQPFSEIILSGNVDIRFTQGDTLKVEAYGNEKAIESKNITSNNNILIVSKKEDAPNNAPTIKLLITAPSLERVNVTGAGDIDFKGEIVLEGNLDLNVSGAGNVNINKLVCNDLDIKITGAGDVTANKITSQKATIQTCGAGDVDASIKATDILLTISGAGDADLNVKCDNLIVISAGAGDVELKGECTNLTKTTSGMASIDSRKLSVKNISIKK